jgi:penicillin-binding protein 1B
LIQGPSLYDPRRSPERAKQRRDAALAAMEDQALINHLDRLAASKAPLGVTERGAIDRSRYPAFLELVRQQLARDYPEARLDAAGFTIHTTLAPSTQALAERAVAQQLKAIEKPKRPLQAAMVVTSAKEGAIEALVGSRDAGDTGFNRAIATARPIGSLVKPFVYLVALAQPERYSLVTPLEDSAVDVPLAGGRVWRPGNVDDVEHGTVPLMEALAHSYNMATVRLGMELDVSRVQRVLEALVPNTRVNPNPSLLLGALDLSPVQVAQAYQYLAADGRPLPLRALDAVLDGDGKPLKRYVTPPTAGDLISASRLVTFALQETSRSGTAHALVGLGLGGLNAAGKTGTSNDQRDSWFAGYTGSHLAVAWVGTDDNKETGLYGATGALKVWAALFQRLPTTPLKLTLGKDPELAWVDMQYAALTDANCPGARELPFAQGHSPEEFVPCGGGSSYGADAAGQPHKAESLGRRILRWFERPKKEAGDKNEQ